MSNTPSENTPADIPAAEPTLNRLRYRWLLPIGILFMFAAVSLWLVLRGMNNPPRISYFVTWQVVLDADMTKDLTEKLTPISLVGDPTAFQNQHGAVNENYTESFKGPLPAELKKPQKTTWEGYRGAAALVRKIVDDRLAAGQKLIISNNLRWNYDHMAAARLRRGIDPLTLLSESISRLFSGRQTPYTGITSLEVPMFNESNNDGQRSLMGHGHLSFQIASRAGGGKRVIVDGQIYLDARELKSGPPTYTEQSFSGTSRIQWGQILKQGDAVVVLARNPRMKGIGEAVMFVCERVDLPADFDDQSQIAREIRPWLHSGPERIERLIETARNWSARGVSTLTADQRWSKQLTDGRWVTLLALGRPQAAPFLWWTPDGKPVSAKLLPNFDKPNTHAPGAAILRITPSGSAPPSGESVDLEVAGQRIQRSTFSNGEVSRLVIGPAGKPFTNLDQMESFLLVPVWNLDRLDEVKVDVNFGTGSWKSIGTVPAAKESEGVVQGYKIKIHDFHEHQFSGSSNRVVLFCQVHTPVPEGAASGPPPLEELRLEAVTKSGLRVPCGSQRGVDAPDPRQKKPSQFGLTEELNGIRFSEIDRFDVQLRPVENLQIGPVNFAPEGLPVEPAATTP